MKPPGRFADQLLQARFDVHVDVFKLNPVGKGFGLYLFQHLIETALNGLIVLSGDDARLGEHVGMRAAARNVLKHHATIHIDRGIDRLHDIGRLRGKASSPHLLAFCGLIYHVLHPEN